MESLISHRLATAIADFMVGIWLLWTWSICSYCLYLSSLMAKISLAKCLDVNLRVSRSGGIGRRARFRGVYSYECGGSTPPCGTFLSFPRQIFVHFHARHGDFNVRFLLERLIRAVIMSHHFFCNWYKLKVHRTKGTIKKIRTLASSNTLYGINLINGQ